MTGTYLAWLSDATESPATRLVHSPGRYVRTDGVPIAANWQSLVTRDLLAPLNRTERGQEISSDREAWTNTAPDGTQARSDLSLFCGGWTSTGGSGRVGETEAIDGDWTDGHSDQCTDQWRLFCFQQ